MTLNINSYHLSTECRKFLLAILNTNVEQRLDSSQIITSEWPMMMLLEQPKHLIKSHAAKYTIDNCLPPEIQFPRQQPLATSSYTITSQAPVHMTVLSQGMTHQVHPDPTTATKTPRPLVAKIGACGRRIADAVKHVGNHHPHRPSRGGVPERATA